MKSRSYKDDDNTMYFKDDGGVYISVLCNNKPVGNNLLLVSASDDIRYVHRYSKKQCEEYAASIGMKLKIV
jgi:hypothetical protein